jgi:hypothetical protein
MKLLLSLGPQPGYNPIPGFSCDPVLKHVMRTKVPPGCGGAGEQDEIPPRASSKV